MKDRIYFCYYDGTYDFQVYQETEADGLMELYVDDYRRPHNVLKRCYENVAYGLDRLNTEENIMDNVLTIHLKSLCNDNIDNIDKDTMFFLKLCKYLNWGLYIIQDSVMVIVNIKEEADETT